MSGGKVYAAIVVAVVLASAVGQEFVISSGTSRMGQKRRECTTDADCTSRGTCREGLCVCRNGYSGRQCKYSCPGTTFNATDAVTVCSGHGRCEQGLRGRCMCDEGYYGRGCDQEFVVPTTPTSVGASEVEQTAMVLSWQAPSNEDGANAQRVGARYTVEMCKLSAGCDEGSSAQHVIEGGELSGVSARDRVPSSRVRSFAESSSNWVVACVVNEPRCRVTNLEVGSRYRFRVQARFRRSRGSGYSVVFERGTAASLPHYETRTPIVNESVTATSIRVRPVPPRDIGGGELEAYVRGYMVEFRKQGTSEWSQATADVAFGHAENTTITVSGLDVFSSYEIRTRARNVAGYGNASSIVVQKTAGQCGNGIVESGSLGNGVSYSETCDGGSCCDNCQLLQNTCNGHGTCVSATECNCAAGYSGSQCQYSDAVTCNSRGTVNGDGTCSCAADSLGNWQQLAHVASTSINVQGSHYTNGYGTPGSGNVWIKPCGTFSNLGSGSVVHMRVTMGSVVDIFYPSGSNSLCDMLTSFTKHVWYNPSSFSFVTPSYYSGHLGGSSVDYPNSVDGRRYLSFWGGSTYRGCCHARSSLFNAPVDTAAWNQDFDIYVRTVQDWTGPQCQYSSSATCGSKGKAQADGTCRDCYPGLYGPQCQNQCNCVLANSESILCSASGACTCKSGYSGRRCQCSAGQFGSGESCSSCHVSCTECSGPSANECSSCKWGYFLVGTRCESGITAVTSNSGGVTTGYNTNVAGRTLQVTKRTSTSWLRVEYNDNFRSLTSTSTSACNWEVLFNGASCPSGRVSGTRYSTSSQNWRRPGTIVGYCRGLSAGTVTLTVRVTQFSSYGCQAETGWNGKYFTLEATEVEPDNPSTTSSFVQSQSVPLATTASVGTGASGTDTGYVSGRSLTFTKKRSDSLMRFTYYDSMRAYQNQVSCDWEVRVDDQSYSSSPLRITVYQEPADNPLHFRTLVGYWPGIAAGSHTMQIYVSPTSGYSGDCYTGWPGIDYFVLEAREVMAGDPALHYVDGINQVDTRDSGVITGRSLSFTKQNATTALRIVYHDNLSAESTSGARACKWTILIDNSPCQSGDISSSQYTSGPQRNRKGSTVIGYCTGVPAGSRTITVSVGAVSGYSCDAYTGWNQRWTLEANEVVLL